MSTSPGSGPEESANAQGDNAVRIGSIRDNYQLFQRFFVTAGRASRPQVQVPL